MSNPRHPQRLASSHAPSRPGGGRDSLLKLLVAGVDSDTRGLVEAAVRHALGSRVVSEPWTVSLVRIGEKWSVTLDGPEPRFRNVSFTTAQERLSTAIREAIGAPMAVAGVGQAPGSAATMVAGDEARVQHACERCQQPFSVSFESRPGEARVLAAVACPHCWEINRVEIGAWAAAGKDYKAEKA